MTQGLLPLKLEKSDDTITPHAGLLLLSVMRNGLGLYDSGSKPVYGCIARRRDLCQVRRKNFQRG